MDLARTALTAVMGGDAQDRLSPELSARLDAGIMMAVRLAVVAPVGLVALHFVNAYLLGHEVDWFDANLEGTLISWASGMATASVAIAALLAAMTMTAPVAPMMTLAAIAAFFSMDDVIGFHDKLSGHMVRQGGLASEWDSVLWPIVYLPLAVVVAVLAARVGHWGTAGSFNAVLGGLGLLVVAIGLEVVSAPWSEGTNAVHTIEGGVEEAMELAGWILIGAGVLCGVIANIVRVEAGRRETSSVG